MFSANLSYSSKTSCSRGVRSSFWDGFEGLFSEVSMFGLWELKDGSNWGIAFVGGRLFNSWGTALW